MKLIDKVKIIDIDKLSPYTNNPKEHPPEQINKIASSIKNFGFTVPIIIDHQNEIIAGHGRYKAAQKLELDKIPCIVRDDLNEAQVKALRLADNKVTESEWDEELLTLELEDLDMQDFDLELTGFENEEIEELFDSELESEEDNFNLEDELDNDNIVSKSGDIIKLGKHRLMCGDSTKEKDVNKLMNGEKADMVFTDPPYGIDLDTDYSDRKSDTFQGGIGGKKHDKVIGDNEDFSPKLINTIFLHFADVKEIFIWGAEYFTELIQDKNDGSWVVWDKRANGNDNIAEDNSSDKMYGSCFELCWSKSKHKRLIARIKWAGIFGMPSQDTKGRVHPTQKPVELCAWFLNNWGKESDIVADLFGGSGPTLIAAEQLNRICYMMELDEKYVDVIIRRYINYRLDNNKEVNIKVNGEEVEYNKYLNDIA
jgi:DNA modification methylase